MRLCRITVPAGRGRAFQLDRGDAIRVVNTHGKQVVDTWAISRDDGREHLSMAHTRAVLQSLRPGAGDALQSNLRNPMLTLAEDTSPGVHDMLIRACDAERYRQLGYVGHHDNCRDNYLDALREAGHRAESVPAPLNLFMNVPWRENGDLSFEAPVSAPGDAVVLRAEIDVVVVLSACPQDMVPVNGALQQPTDVDVEILRAEREPAGQAAIRRDVAAWPGGA
jgi:uncharacterized protein YcgI (DUF1989 family)